jgi:general nucleoside transport system ATP-binding protein
MLSLTDADRTISSTVPRLAVDSVTHRYGSLIANNRVSLDLRAGEIHALLGQNGAGKSTLVSVITGRLRPDEGAIELEGESLPLGNPRAMAAHGITAVYQDLMLVPSMTGLENIALALGAGANDETRALAVEAQTEFGVEADLDRPVMDLELPQRQRIELVRALCQKPSVLLLDEPTSLLPPTAIDAFLGKVREVADSGLGVLLITHQLDEARRISDRLTILREGRVVATYERSEVPPHEELARAIVGKRVVSSSPPRASSEASSNALEVDDVTVLDDLRRRAVDGVSLFAPPGQLVGLAGVDGNGQLELLEAIAGLRPVAEGRIRHNGKDVSDLNYGRRLESGIVFVSGDRGRHGIVPTFSVAEHFEYALPRTVARRVPSVLEQYGVRPADPELRADQLSGGNQQKLVLACACERAPSALLLAYPTAGLDVEATTQIRELLLARAAEGLTILIASSELEELLFLCDVIGVMNRGRIVGAQTRDEFDRDVLAQWFTSSRTGAETWAD